MMTLKNHLPLALLLCLAVLAFAPVTIAQSDAHTVEAAQEAAPEAETVTGEETPHTLLNAEFNQLQSSLTPPPFGCNQGAYCTTDADCGFTGYCYIVHGSYGCCNCL